MHKAGAWADWQIRYIEEHYPNDRSAEVAQTIGRSKSAVDHYASRAGIKKNPEANLMHRAEGARRREDSRQKQGYRKQSKKGYWLRFAPWHPLASKAGLVMEHRLIMEGLVGRKLTPNEVVHHINEDRSDNRPENLLLMEFGEHSAYHNHINPKRGRLKSTD